MKQRASRRGWVHSITRRLVALAASIVLPGVLLAWWMFGLTPQLVFGSVVAGCLALLAAIGVSRSIARSLRIIRRMAQDLECGRVLTSTSTGLAECEDTADSLVRASASIQDIQKDTETRVQQAATLSRNAEERLSNNQRLEALGRLTGGVAHDFNNLLGVISNSGHLMLRKTSDPELTSSVEMTLRAVEAGSRLTQHLLRFAGRQAVRPCNISLGAFLPEAAELIRALMGRRIDLQVVIDPSTPSVFADPNELELALINLALNAREAIDERGHVTLRAAIAHADDTQDLPSPPYVVISVTDDGSGISDVITQRVFEPFFSTKSERQATGLGLSQVYGFCQQSGGAVRLNSTLGLGTSVSMILPTRNAFPLAIQLPASDQWPPIAGTRVLLVEDHPELREVTMSLLSSFGCDVVSSASAQDALRILRNTGDIDVMLTDVLMPGPMNGVSLSRYVEKQFPGLPIVLISGHGGDLEDRDEFPFVAKPYTPEALVAALRGAMAATWPR